MYVDINDSVRYIKKDSRRNTRKTTTTWKSKRRRGSPQVLIPFLHIKVTILLKYLSNFWRSLDLPLINCESRA